MTIYTSVFASWIRHELIKMQLIFSRISGPILSVNLWFTDVIHTIYMLWKTEKFSSYLMIQLGPNDKHFSEQNWSICCIYSTNNVKRMKKYGTRQGRVPWHFVLSTPWRLLWSITVHTHAETKSICFIHQVM